MSLFGSSRSNLWTGYVVAILLVWFFPLSARSAAQLPLHNQRSSPDDLEITGQIEGLAPGHSRYARWSDLSALPTKKMVLTGEFVPGAQEVTIVFLSDLWTALPHLRNADTLLASCTDGYASIYRLPFIESYRPFLILAINGVGPDRWPPPGLTFNPGPYVISVSADIVPAVSTLLDASHKRPWGVVKIEVTTAIVALAGILKDPWGSLDAPTNEGREIWINSCASCHRGPPQTFEGTKSDRTFGQLVSLAAKNPAYFRRYVRDPKSLVPTAKMEPHPHYTEVQLDALIAFLSLASSP